jgi:hypothetical protein
VDLSTLYHFSPINLPLISPFGLGFGSQNTAKKRKLRGMNNSNFHLSIAFEPKQW